MNVPPTAAAGISFGQDLDHLKKLPEGEALAKLGREFESIFVREILKNAQKTVIQSSVNQENGSSSIYRDMLVENLAHGIRDAGGMGLAQALERDLARQVSAEFAEPATDSQKEASHD